jgi:hypothetical protein
MWDFPKLVLLDVYYLIFASLAENTIKVNVAQLNSFDINLEEQNPLAYADAL